MFRYLILVALVPAIVFGVEFNKCSKGPAPLSLSVVGCDSQPCNLVRGKNTEFQFLFEVLSDVDELRTTVFATVFGLTTEYPLPSEFSNVCEHIGTDKCPLEKGEQITVSLSIPVLEFYPLISLNIEISLVEKNNTSIVHSCFNLDAKVVEPEP
uniref:Putative ml domain salivary peptide n=1 Tax=Corethrella appendiculata TaxID=1370023 RepID=U5EZP3_9DIPT